MIRMENVIKIYNKGAVETKALDGINLTIETGSLVSVMGPSGSGKSTLLNIIGAMDRLTSGTYEVDGVKINELTRKQLHRFRRDNISFVFQNFALMNKYTVYENVELPLLAKNIKRPRRRVAVMEQLEKVGIAELKDKYPTAISGGQQQRCAIARALASGNDILLADEPTGALDQKTGEDIIGVLKNINSMGKTVIIVTHDLNVANKCDRIINVVDGKLN